MKYEIKITPKERELLAMQYVLQKGLKVNGENRIDEDGGLRIGYEEEE